MVIHKPSPLGKVREGEVYKEATREFRNEVFLSPTLS